MTALDSAITADRALAPTIDIGQYVPRRRITVGDGELGVWQEGAE
jgi:hypothetical protein